MNNLLSGGANVTRPEQLGKTSIIQPPSQRAQLAQLETELRARLEAVSEGISLLDKMPDIERLATLLQRIY